MYFQLSTTNNSSLKIPDNNYFLSTFHPCHCHREPKWRIQLQKILEEIYGLFWKALNCQITVNARSWHFFTNSESTSTTDQKCCSNCLFSQKMWRNCGFIVSEFVKIFHELFFNKMKIWAQMYPDKCKRVRKACFLNFPCIFYIAVTNFYKIQFFFLCCLHVIRKAFKSPFQLENSFIRKIWKTMAKKYYYFLSWLLMWCIPLE